MIPRYRYIASFLGAPYSKIAELPLTGVEWQRLRNGGGTFKGDLKLPPPVSTEARVLCRLWREATDAATTCIYVIRDNVPMGAYAVWEQGYSSSNQTISVSGAELSSYWRRRIIEDVTGDLDVRVSYEGLPMFDSVADLVARVNDIGLAMDVTTGGPALPVTVPATDDTSEIAGTGWKGTDAKTTADAVDELAAMDDGFDYRTDLRRNGGDYQRVFMLRESLSGPVGLIAKYGSSLSAFQVKRRGDVRTNDAIALGGSDGEKRPYGRVTDTSYSPRLTTVTQQNDDADQDRLDAAAQALIDASRTGEVVTFDVSEDGVDAVIGGFFPGDNVRIIVEANKDPWYCDGLDKIVPTLGYTVTVPDSGGRESIGLSIDEGDLSGV